MGRGKREGDTVGQRGKGGGGDGRWIVESSTRRRRRRTGATEIIYFEIE